jgi:ComF family protein
MALHLLTCALAALFPWRCAFCGRVVAGEQKICPACADALKAAAVTGETCPVCGRGIPFCICGGQAARGFPFAFAGSVSPFYYEGVAKRGILRLKFEGKRQSADAFADCAAQALRRSRLPGTFDLVTAVPLSRREQRARGYNQSELFGRALAARIGAPYRPALRKERDTRPQRECGAAERWGNVENAFAACPDALPRDARVLLADDIFTTGATLHACAQALLGAGAQTVCCVTIACVRLSGRPPRAP